MIYGMYHGFFLLSITGQ